MIIKKYRADNLEEAKRIVEKELGPEAIILTTRPVKEGGLKSLFLSESVEVTAAIGEAELEAYNVQKATTSQKSKQSMLKKAPEPVKAVPGIKSAPVSEKHLGNLGQNLEDLKKTVNSISAASNDGMDYGDQVILSSQARNQAKTSTQKIAPPIQEAAPRLKPKIRMPIETIDDMPEETQTEVRRSEKGPETAMSASFNDLSRRLVEEFTKEDAENKEVPRKTERPVEKKEASKNTMNTQQAPLRKAPKRKVELNSAVLENASIDLNAIRQIVREEFKGAQKAVRVGPLTAEQDTGVGSVPFLISKGVSRSIAVQIQENIEERLGAENPRESKAEKATRLNTLKMEIASRIKSSGPILLRQGEPALVSLVGPTGVGKTTTLMRIAEQYKGELGKKVGVITLDLEKVGALEQIQAMSRAVGVPCQYAENAMELKRAIANFNDRDLILIDTGGCSQYNWKEVDALNEILAELEGLHVLLTISSTTKDVDVFGIIDQFSMLNIESLIFTKLDETIGYGILLNACDKMHLPISYLTTGRKSVENLVIANDSDLARRILVENNSKEYKRLREVASS